MTGFFHFYWEEYRDEGGGIYVSMPYDGLFSFLHTHDSWSEEDQEVSMPYDGLFSFLRAGLGKFLRLLVGVNALRRAFFISTIHARICSISVAYRCQCPTTGFFHFYKKMNSFRSNRPRVSMPYDGLFSFLHSGNGVSHQGYRSVSMPYDGLFSFLRYFGPSAGHTKYVCQCPTTGFFHFYRRRVHRHVPTI